MASRFYSRLRQKLKNSDLVNKNENIQDCPEKLDNSYLESAIYTLWKIDIVNLIKTKAVLAKEFHIQPSELEILPFWEYEIFMQELNDLIKDENKKQEDEMGKYDLKGMNKMTKPGGMNKMMPKTPSVPNINISTPSMKF